MLEKEVSIGETTPEKGIVRELFSKARENLLEGDNKLEVRSDERIVLSGGSRALIERAYRRQF